MCNSDISDLPGVPPAYLRPEDRTADRGAMSAKELKAWKRRQFPPLPEPLPAPIIDNHTHLNLRAHLPAITPSQALDAAEQAGVTRAVQVAFDLESARFTAGAVDADPRLLGAVALHPNEAPVLDEQGKLEEALQEIEQIARHPRIRALGETGLDYYRTGPEGVEAQQRSFRAHIDIAQSLGKAIQIHDRDAHEDVVRILLQAKPTVPVVFHCFSGDAALARICNEHGWRMSFSGTVTFGNSKDLQEALSTARRDLILVETDSPYLTPHPYRGQPNASYMCAATARFMAQHLGAALEDLCHELTANTEAVYGQW